MTEIIEKTPMEDFMIRMAKTQEEDDARVREIKKLAKQLDEDRNSMQAHKVVTATLAIPLLQASGVSPEDVEAQKRRILAQENPMIVAQAYLSVKALDPALQSVSKATTT